MTGIQFEFVTDENADIIFDDSTHPDRLNAVVPNSDGIIYSGLVNAGGGSGFTNMEPVSTAYIFQPLFMSLAISWVLVIQALTMATVSDTVTVTFF